MTQKLAGMVSGLNGLIDPTAVLEVVATGSTWSEGQNTIWHVLPLRSNPAHRHLPNCPESNSEPQNPPSSIASKHC